MISPKTGPASATNGDTLNLPRASAAPSSNLTVSLPHATPAEPTVIRSKPQNHGALLEDGGAGMRFVGGAAAAGRLTLVERGGGGAGRAPGGPGARLAAAASKAARDELLFLC